MAKNAAKKDRAGPAIHAIAIPARKSNRGINPPPVETRWKPGQSGNPAGRPPAAGLSIKEWLNQMASWPPDRIAGVFDDPKASAAKLAAARVWMDATSRDRSAVGTPIAGAELDRIADRTVGKPLQELQIDGQLAAPTQVIINVIRPTLPQP